MAELVTSPGTRFPALSRAASGGLAVVALAAATWLAVNHPLGSAPAAGAVFALMAITFWLPGIWPVLLLALFPVCDLAVWSGWLGVEEFDLIVLACAASGYAKLAVKLHTDTNRMELGVPPLQQLLLVAYAILLMASMVLGVNAAGGWHVGLFDNYHQPLASLRLVKPALWLALLTPLWWAGYSFEPERQMSRVSLGMMLGLGACSLATICERLAFTGFLNFSTDYRTTAMFWEMHIGGASLDGYLALTLPFVARELLVTSNPRRWALAAGIAALALYACLTTFSRGVYLMLATTLPCCIFLFRLQSRRGAHAAGTRASSMPLVPVLAVAAFAAAAAAWMFPTSGYRGLMALLGSLSLVVLWHQPLASMPRVQKILTALGGLALGAVLAAASPLIAKGPYLTFGLLFLCGLVLWVTQIAHADLPRRWLLPSAAAVTACTVVCMVGVAWHWGGEAAGSHALAAALVLILARFLPRGTSDMLRGLPEGRSALTSIRRQVLTLGIAAAAMSMVAVFDGGAYMEGRFSTGSQDMAYRLQHWRQVLTFLGSDGNWWLGEGLGRYPATHLLRSTSGDNPGDHRWNALNGNGTLVLTSGNHQLGYGEIYRVSQRIKPPSGGIVADLRVRTEQPTSIYLEVCEKHLLYSGACLLETVDLQGTSGEWQTVRARLSGSQPTTGAWYAPRQIVFSVAVGKRSTKIELDDIKLTDDEGRSLLANGDFQGGLARWFFSSDRFHMPWHTKNLFLHVLFDQGVAGLLVWSVLVSTALWRTTIGSARQHALAPALASAMIGFLVIGLFDSLVDSARLSFLWGAVVIVALTVRSVGTEADLSAVGTRPS